MVYDVGPESARNLVASGLALIDVRESGEWANGHAPEARHVPLARLRSDAESELARDGVIFVCAAGTRSEAAARLASERGLTKVYNLRGGMRGWARAGLPLVRD